MERFEKMPCSQISDLPNKKVTLLNGKLITIASNKKEGFNYGYVLFIPQNICDDTCFIIEGSNASRSANSIDEANEVIKEEASFPSLPIFRIANKLGLPVLYPLFPRIYNGKETIYNHMLSTNSLLESTNKLSEFELNRVDLQLIAMFKDASKKLSDIGISIDNKFIIDGFSASAKFANRFTVLHPEYVKLCIAGGVSGILTLPIKELNNHELLWPVGLGNIKKLINEEITDKKIEQFKNVDQFYYMGSLDRKNNPFCYDDDKNVKYKGIINKDELDQIYDIFGNDPIDERWVVSQELYKKLGVNASFGTYLGCDHDPRPAKKDVENKITQVLELDLNKEITRK